MAHKLTASLKGFAPARELTARADETITGLFEASLWKQHSDWCIVALGGYGRQELCPFSDVDLLFLVGRKASRGEIEKALQELLYPLWDAGFNASHSVRTLKQVLEDARTDFFFRNSLIDARFVCGSLEAFEAFTKAFSKSRYARDTRRYLSDLAFHTRKRHEKYGDAAYFIEPHIKDGHGGLRDCQSIQWVLKVMAGAHEPQPVSSLDLEELHAANDFLLQTRFLLHKLTNRKTDRMFLEHQEQLALEMGYKNRPGETPVEAFLKDYHTRVLTIRSMIDPLLLLSERPSGLKSLFASSTKDGHFTFSSGLLEFTRPDDAAHDPHLIMKAFTVVSERDTSLSPASRSLVKSFIRSHAGLKRNEDACHMLLKILRGKNAENALLSMLETGLIEQLIPEFSFIRGRTIFDVYHTFTVDLHSIHTVSMVRELEDTDPEIFGRVPDKDVLYFSAFMHDIGKGYGSPHADRGAEVIVPIARSFGFDEAQVDLIVFLLKNHLLLADMAARRDLSEEKVISDLAQRIGSASKLAMLYLLTVADSKSTGPNAWNEWKSSLLWELYTRTLNFLEKGILKSRRNAMRLEDKWHRLVRQTETKDGALLSGRLWALPQAYVLASDFEDIRTHVSLSSQLSGPDDIRVEVSHRRNHTQLTVITRDRPGLFSLLTGILAVNRMEIVSANIFTWYDGTVVDTFKVLPPWQDYHEWGAIETGLRECLAGKTDIKTRLRKTKALKTEVTAPVRSPDDAIIVIDNETSDFFTIIDVRAHQRPGLTHDISLALSALSLDIHRAFLSRSADLAACVFYVVDRGGEKILGTDAQQELLEKIRDATRSPRLPSSPGDEKTLYSKSKKKEKSEGQEPC